LADNAATPEFAVTNTDGKVIATFTITTDGQVNSANEVVADMVTTIIKARNWTADQASRALNEGWSNGYVTISRQPN
jgi:hypothetical protein